MPSIYELKPAFQNLLRPIVGALARAGVTANQVTVAAMVLSFATGAAIALWPQSRWPMFAVPVVLIVRMGLNAIDGMLAREHDMKSKTGAVLNEIGDVASDAALYLPFMRVAPLNPELVVIVVVLSIMSEMAGIIAQVLSGERRYDGPMGKSDRAFVFGMIALALGLGFDRALWLNGLLGLTAVLLLVTVINRSRAAVRGEP